MAEGGNFSYRGVTFKLNEIVNIVDGTAAGTRGRRSEAIRAWFKGEDNLYSDEHSEVLVKVS